MKFKKTYFLLMIISLFLLVSIGFVCAEDVTADADIQSTDVESVEWAKFLQNFLVFWEGFLEVEINI